MKLEKELSEITDDVKNQIKAYSELRLALFKVEVTEKVSKSMGALVANILVASIALFVLLFSSIVCGFYFSDYFGSFTKGFGVVALFYIVLVIIVLLVKNSLIAKPITNAIITSIFEEEKL